MDWVVSWIGLNESCWTGFWAGFWAVNNSHYFWGQLLSHFMVVDGGPYKADCVYLVFVLRLDYY